MSEIQIELNITEENNILTLTMDAPDKNRMTDDFLQMFEGVADRLKNIAAEREDIKGLIIRGNGKHFSKGAVVEALVERTDRELQPFGNAEEALPKGHTAHKNALLSLTKLPFPVVAVVNGFCIGAGAEMAINCHYRIVEPRARISQPELTLGIVPALGGMAKTIYICGIQNAYELVMFGDMISADKAIEIGWADIAAEKNAGYDEAVHLINFIADNVDNFDCDKVKEYLELYKTTEKTCGV